jgi:hypothetical protein
MAELEEAVVAPDVEGIREQAAKLGYIVKQKGRREISPGSSLRWLSLLTVAGLHV